MAQNASTFSKIFLSHQLFVEDILFKDILDWSNPDPTKNQKMKMYTIAKLEMKRNSAIKFTLFRLIPIILLIMSGCFLFIGSKWAEKKNEWPLWICISGCILLVIGITLILFGEWLKFNQIQNFKKRVLEVFELELYSTSSNGANNSSADGNGRIPTGEDGGTPTGEDGRTPTGEDGRTPTGEDGGTPTGEDGSNLESNPSDRPNNDKGESNIENATCKASVTGVNSKNHTGSN